MPSWYLIYTKPKCEDNVGAKLSKAGFEVLNPRIKERKYRRERAAEVISPLFPCYVFARFDKFRDYHLVRYTRGIRRVLSSEDGPAEIPDMVVDSITARMDGGVISIRGTFTPGQTVIVRGGPFEGLSAIFDREMSAMERVCILLKAINVRLVIDRCMIAPC